MKRLAIDPGKYWRRGTKYFLFDWYGVIAVAALVAVVVTAFLVAADNAWELAGAGAFGVLLATFTFQQRRTEELRLFNELFRNFNDRFNVIFRERADCRANAGDAGQRETNLRQYCDLCAEEYFFFDLGSIRPSVWESWCEGIRRFLEDPEDARFVRETLADGRNYYGLTWDTILYGAERHAARFPRVNAGG